MVRLAVRGCLLFLLTLGGNAAWALTEWTALGWSGPSSTFHTSADAACTAHSAVLGGGRVFHHVAIFGTSPNRTGTCYATIPPATSEFTAGSTAEICPQGGGWTKVVARLRCERTVAQCPAGQTADENGFCQPPPPCTAGETKASGFFDIGTDPKKHPLMAGCMGGCEVAFDGVSPAGNSLVDGVKHYYALGEYVTTGAECTVGTNPGSGSPDVPPPDCDQGQVLGEVNGQPVCAAGDTGAPVVPPKTETETTTKTPPVDNGDGTTTETETTTREVTNPDGSTGTQTQTTTTTCDQAGNCESTTETETDGAYVDPAAQEEQPSECELHPNTAGCAELDTPTGPDLPTSNVSISGVSPQSGWGADNATCPALVHTVSLGDVDVFGLVCTYMQGIRFLVIGIAWLIAALIFIGRTD